MNGTTTREDAFADLLEGEAGDASPDVVRMAKLVRSLEVRPSGMRPSFRTALRARLVEEARLSSAPAEAEAFETLLQGETRGAPLELVRMARIAGALRARPAEVPDGFRSALRARLVGEAAHFRRLRVLDGARERLRARNEAWRRSLRVVAAVAAAVMMLSSAGAVFAAAERALPGQRLYAMKTWREAAGLALTFGDEAKGLRLLSLSRQRMLEIYALEDRGVDSGAPYLMALDRMDRFTVEASSRLVRAYRKKRNADLMVALQRFAHQQRLDLVGIIDRLPPEARPVALDSIALVERVAEQSGNVLRGCPCPENPLAPSTATVQGEAAGQQAQCACERRVEGGFSRSGDDGGGQEPGKEPDGNGEPPGGTTPPPPDPNTLPDLDGTELDDDAEDLIEEILPTPLPTLSVPNALP